jgi:transcriptional accessory protein Tex/SPT6
VGQEIAGPISRLQDKGVAVDLGNDVEGFVPVSQIGVTGLQNPADVFAEGDVLDMRISEVDAANHRIVCEVVRVPKFEGGEPQFIQLATPAAPAAADEGEEVSAEGEETSVNPQITDAVEGEAPTAEAPAAAPAADEAEETVAEAPAAESAPTDAEGSETTASAEEAPAAEASAEEAPASDEAAEEA